MGESAKSNRAFRISARCTNHAFYPRRAERHSRRLPRRTALNRYRQRGSGCDTCNVGGRKMRKRNPYEEAQKTYIEYLVTQANKLANMVFAFGGSFPVSAAEELHAEGLTQAIEDAENKEGIETWLKRAENENLAYYLCYSYNYVHLSFIFGLVGSLNAHLHRRPNRQKQCLALSRLHLSKKARD